MDSSRISRNRSRLINQECQNISSMSESTISFDNQDEIRTLLGVQDRFLRQVRDSVGIDVVIRGDQLRLRGDEDQIRRGQQIFAELRAIIGKTGFLSETQVQHVLRQSDGEIPSAVRSLDRRPSRSEQPINLYEKSKSVSPRSPGQAEYVEAIRENELVFCTGPAGSGKTYLAVAMAVNALRSELARKIVLVRPAVEAGEKLGFLPGDLFAKVNPYLRPLLDALGDLLSFEQVQRYLESDIIEIVPLAFMRGRTLNHTFIILDEAQNTTVTQMKMFLTRMGNDSRIVVTGDPTQVDLPPHVDSGLQDACNRLSHISGVARVRLTGRDIVRHPLVARIVDAYHDEGSQAARHRTDDVQSA